MQRVFGTLILLLSAAQSYAADDAKPAATTEATYSITGLHCPPCTRTVESSLRKLKGLKSVKVDWGSKSAKVEFDEGVLPAQKLAQAVAHTPHMMGSGLSYGSWLALKAPDVKDEASAKAAKDALSKLPGVAKVSALPAQQIISVQFADEGTLTSHDLIETVAKAGFKATDY